MYFLNKVGLLTHSSVLIIWRLFNPYKDVKFQFVISCSERFISISDFASLVNIVIFFFWGLVDEDCLSKKALKYWLSFMPNECPNIVIS